MGGFVWSEAALVAMGGVALGAVGAAVLAEILVKMLTGVFDPPPASLSVPWGYLAVLTAVALGAVAIASTVTIRSARRPALIVLRDL